MRESSQVCPLEGGQSKGYQRSKEELTMCCSGIVRKRRIYRLAVHLHKPMDVNWSIVMNNFEEKGLTSARIRGCQVFKLNVQRLSIQTVLKLKISGVTGVISGGDESRSCVYGAYKEYKCSENYSES